jgi:hypothetical protein
MEKSKRKNCHTVLFFFIPLSPGRGSHNIIISKEVLDKTELVCLQDLLESGNKCEKQCEATANI